MGAYTDPRELIFYKYTDMGATNKFENYYGINGFQTQFFCSARFTTNLTEYRKEKNHGVVIWFVLSLIQYL